MASASMTSHAPSPRARARRPSPCSSRTRPSASSAATAPSGCGLGELAERVQHRADQLHRPQLPRFRRHQRAPGRAAAADADHLHALRRRVQQRAEHAEQQVPFEKGHRALAEAHDEKGARPRAAGDARRFAVEGDAGAVLGARGKAAAPIGRHGVHAAPKGVVAGQRERARRRSRGRAPAGCDPPPSGVPEPCAEQQRQGQRGQQPHASPWCRGGAAKGGRCRASPPRCRRCWRAAPSPRARRRSPGRAAPRAARRRRSCRSGRRAVRPPGG